MQFEKKEHDKLIENVEKIFNYLIENVVPKICHKFKIIFPYENGKLNLVIYPKTEKGCFELTTDSDIHLCMNELRKYFYDGRYQKQLYYDLNGEYTPLMFDFKDQDEIMYAVVENFEYIKEKCNEAFDKDKEMKQKIISFDI